MSETKHTPGPWVYRPHEYDDWGWVRGGTPDEGGYLPLIACARSGVFEATDYAEHRSNKTDPFEANARLIAEAPELLELLRKLSNEVMALEGFEGSVREAIGNTNYGVLINRAIEARAVIAKAEGR